MDPRDVRSENSLALSYLFLYQTISQENQSDSKSNDPGTNDSSPGRERKEKPVVNEGTADEAMSTTDDIWEEYEWTESDEVQVQQQLDKSEGKCRIQQHMLTNNAYFQARDDPDAWNGFYRHHQTKFFKDRHYLSTAFPNEFVPATTTATTSLQTPKRVLVEIGCGVGNALLPLLEESKQDSNASDLSLTFQWTAYGLDLSSVAIDLLKQDERYIAASKEGRAHAFCSNIVDGIPPECEQVAHVSSLLFCLSAIDPTNDQVQAVRHAAKTLRPGGCLVFRDYGRFDESQMKLGNQRSKQLKDNFYRKHDATKCYFFTTQNLERLFVQEAGLEKLELHYIRRLYKNRSTNSCRRRVWVHGRFRKPIK